MRSFSSISWRELIVGLLQLTDGLLEIGGQPVERLAELRDFVPFVFTETGIFGGEIQLAHAVGKACHRDQRPGELARDEVAADQADQQRAAACNDQKHQIERGILLDIGIWHIGEQALLRVFIQRTGKAQILVVVPQLDVQELVFAGGERVPVEVLRNGLQDDIAAPLLLKQIKVGQLEGVLRAGAAVFRCCPV